MVMGSSISKNVTYKTDSIPQLNNKFMNNAFNGAASRAAVTGESFNDRLGLASVTTHDENHYNNGFQNLDTTNDNKFPNDTTSTREKKAMLIDAKLDKKVRAAEAKRNNRGSESDSGSQSEKIVDRIGDVLALPRGIALAIGNDSFPHEITTDTENSEVITTSLKENGMLSKEAIDQGANISASLIKGVFTKVLNPLYAASGAFERTSSATRNGTEDMVMRDKAGQRTIEGVEILNLNDPNDPNARKLRDINTDLTEDTDSDKHVNDGKADTEQQKLNDKSKISSAQKMQNVDNDKDTEEQKLDDKSSVDKKKKLEDIDNAEGIDEQILQGFDDLNRKDLYNVYNENGKDKQEYDGKSSVLGASLRNIAKTGGTDKQKINENSLISPEELASIVKGSLADFNEFDSSSSIDRPVILADITGNSEKTNDQEVNKDTLEEVTDALANFGEEGSNEDIASDLDRTIGDLGMSDSGISDLASSIASDVVSSELGK